MDDERFKMTFKQDQRSIAPTSVSVIQSISQSVSQSVLVPTVSETIIKDDLLISM